MQTWSYAGGKWRAEARLEEIETGRLMAVISVTDDKGSAKNGSKHTVVFEHEEGRDQQEETESLVRRLLNARYGM